MSLPSPWEEPIIRKGSSPPPPPPPPLLPYYVWTSVVLLLLLMLLIVCFCLCIVVAWGRRGGGGGSGRHNFQISATFSLSIQLTVSVFDEHSSSFHILPLISFRSRNLFLTKNHPNKLLLSRTSKNRRRIYDWTRQADSPLYPLQ